MNALLTAGTGLSNFACSAEECLSWIIILLNILTVFYLVFCAWFKITKTVKIVGYVWASALAVGTIAVVAVHACIFTILSAVFTGLILMAVLSVVFNKGAFAKDEDETEKPRRAAGSYVIHRTDDKKFVFVVYNTKKTAVGKSFYKYDTLDEVKIAVATCRENGLFASVENKTKNWIEFANHPKFIMEEDNGKFSFRMTLIDETDMLVSDTFDISDICEKAMKEAYAAVKSERLYYSDKEILSGAKFYALPGKEVKQVAVKPAAKVPVKVVPVAEEPVTEDEEPAQEIVATVEEPVVEEIVPTQETPIAKETFDMSDEEEEGTVYVDENGNLYSVIYNKSFKAKICQLDDKSKKYYNVLKNRVLAYAKTKSRISWNADTISSKRDILLKFAVKSKTLCIYFALNPDDYIDSKYKVEKVEYSKFEDAPCLYRIKNDRRVKYASELISIVCAKYGLKKGVVLNNDYTFPYESTSALIAKNMIKKVKRPAPAAKKSKK